MYVIVLKTKMNSEHNGPLRCIIFTMAAIAVWVCHPFRDGTSIHRDSVTGDQIVRLRQPSSKSQQTATHITQLSNHSLELLNVTLETLGEHPIQPNDLDEALRTAHLTGSIKVLALLSQPPVAMDGLVSLATHRHRTWHELWGSMPDLLFWEVSDFVVMLSAVLRH